MDNLKESLEDVICLSLSPSMYGAGHSLRMFTLTSQLISLGIRARHIEISENSDLISVINSANPKLFVLDFAHSGFISSLKSAHSFDRIKSKILIIDGLLENDTLSNFFPNRENLFIAPYCTADMKLPIERSSYWLIGPEYFMFRESFIRKNSPKSNSSNNINLYKSHNVLVSCGYTDKSDLTSSVIENLQNLIKKGMSLNVLITTSPSFSDRQKLTIKSYLRHNNFHDIGRSLDSFVQNTDSFIISSGLIKYELSLFKKPLFILNPDSIHQKANKGFQIESGIKSFMKKDISSNNFKSFFENPNNYIVSRSLHEKLSLSINRPLLAIKIKEMLC